MKKILLSLFLLIELNGAQFEDNKRLCDEGNTVGCYNLGIMFMNGIRGATMDEAKAVKYFKKACNGGDIDGCLNVGKFFEDGIGVKQNHSLAVEFYTKACEGKEPIACMTLGNFYRDGNGVEQNHLKAAEYFKKVCDSGYNEGCKQYEITRSQ